VQENATDWILVQDSTIDDIDQRLAHAVQVSPRASWSAHAPIVGADPVTLARRWQRMSEEGLVYVTGYSANPGDAPLAIVEIECPPGETLGVAEELSQDGEAFTIDLTSGGRDIVVTLATANSAALSSYVLERISPLARIRSMRTQLVSQTVADARNWRLKALNQSEIAAAAAADPLPRRVSPRLHPELERDLMLELGRDGRASAREIAERMGVTPRRVRDGIAALRASGSLVIRVDVARSFTAWPVYAWYFLRVPATMVGKVGPQLSRMDEVRLVVNTVGEYNMIMAVWLRTLHDVQRLEAILEDKMPGLVIADRSVVLRTVKHLGHMLDEGGFATGETVWLPLG
jgi:DNA-binding Lrp family transcriptional regulator